MKRRAIARSLPHPYSTAQDRSRFFQHRQAVCSFTLLVDTFSQAVIVVIEQLALSIVCLAGVYFIVLGALALARPEIAKRFLLGFAGSARAHYSELLVRIVVGGSLVLSSPLMLFSSAFTVFGWVLVGTSAAILLVPWQSHHRFAARSVPPALRFISVIGLGSLALGVFTLGALAFGSQTA
ncbi:MAG: hypothetical protein IPH50_15180 [Rhodanobacteraceae bacterium]|nr:hypothetical protein [Rhodanobacteraceae bacterium]